MRGAWRGLVSAASTFRKLPRWEQFGVLLILAAAVLYPESREMILSGLSSVTSLSRETLRKMAPVVKQAINEIEEAEREIERFEESQFHPDESAVVPHGGNDTGGDARLFFPPPFFHVAEFTRPPRFLKPGDFESLRSEDTSSVEDATLPLLDVTVRGIQD